METGEFVVSNYIVGRLTRKPTFVAVYPTQAIDPNVRAAVITSIDLQWVSNLIATLERRSRIERAADRRPGHRPRRRFRPGRLGRQAHRRHRLVQSDRRSRRGRRARRGPRRRPPHLRVRARAVERRPAGGRPRRSEVLQRTDREILLAYLQLGFFGLLVLLLAWFGGERLIVDPIRSLARTAERFGRGDLRARARARPGPRNSRRSTVALNDMAQQLAEREEELRAANSHLQELATSDALVGPRQPPRLRRTAGGRLAARRQAATARSPC